MKAREIVPSAQQLELIQGVEGNLRRRRKTSTIGGVVAIAAAMLNIVLAALDTGYIENLAELLSALGSLDFQSFVALLAQPETTAVMLVIVAAGTFFIFRWTDFLLKESEEPFRYTFWVEAFTAASDGSKPRFTLENVDRLEALLHHDLRERISKRIPRLSLLSSDSASEAGGGHESSTSHIRVTGTYAVREDRGKQWVIHVMPQVRVGPAGSPETLAHPVRFPLKGVTKDTLDADRYNQLVERVYSQIATEVYKQLESDVQEKVKLFPTPYLRAVALYNEAEDFARSNTVDAYDRAIRLYREALRYFSIANVQPLTNLLLLWPLVWRTQVKFEHFSARIQIGYSKCLIYRRLISALTGRSQKPLFEIRQGLDDVIKRLRRIHQKLHRAGWGFAGRRASRWLLRPGHIKDPEGLARILRRTDARPDHDPITRCVWDQLSEPTRNSLIEHDLSQHLPEPLVAALSADLNRILQTDGFYDKDRFDKESLSELARSKLKWRWLPWERVRLNRLLLEEAYPDIIESHIQYRLSTVMAFLTFPRDSWLRYVFLRPSLELFKTQTRILFEAHVVAALTHHYLGAIRKAKDELENAAAIAPLLTDRQALYLLAAAEIETDLDKEIALFRQATDQAPDFEIAQYRLAQKTDMRFRAANLLQEDRARAAHEEYEAVLRINPGNIAALTAQGYLLWLLGTKKRDARERARRKFEEALDYRAIVRHTFAGEVSYGLARIAAELGQFPESYDRYVQAIESDLGIAAYSAKSVSSSSASALTTTSSFGRIGSEMLERYRSFKSIVARHISRKRNQGKSTKGGAKKGNGKKAGEDTTLDQVYSLVLNDLGNACFNYFLRFGDGDVLNEAIANYEEAIRKDKRNGIAYFNLHHAFAEKYKSSVDEHDKSEARRYLGIAEQFVSSWPAGVISLAQSRLADVNADYQIARRQFQEEMEEIRRERAKLESRAVEPRLLAEGTAGPSVVRPKDGGPESSIPPAAGSSSRAPGRAGRGDGSLAEEKARINQRWKDAEKKRDEAMQKARDNLEESRRQVEKVVARTKLSSVHRGLNFTLDGDGVDALIAAEVERDRLDEYDVGALRLWAEVLARSQDRDTVTAAQRLCHYIESSFYSDNFEVNQTLLDIAQLDSSDPPDGDDGAADGQAAQSFVNRIGVMRLKAERVMRDTVIHWLEADPVHYAALTWTESYFDADQVIGFYQRARDKAPGVAVFHEKIGDRYRAQERWEEARQAYSDAIRCDTKNASYRNMLANLYYWNGEYDDSVGHYEKAIALDQKRKKEALKPTIAIYHSNLGRALRALERYDKAVGHFAASARLEDTASRQADLGLAYREAQRWQEAEGAYLRALKLEPDNASYNNNLGNVYYATGEFEKSIPFYGTATAKDPQLPVYWTNLGGSYRALEQWEGAATAYEEAVKLAKDSAEYRNTLANIYYWDGKYSKSIPHYEEAIRLEPNNAVYLANLGNAFIGLNRWTEAATPYGRAVEIQPENHEYLNMLGNVRYQVSEYQGAAEMFSKALERRPDSALYSANLGSAYIIQKSWTQARDAYKRAIELEPKNASHYNLLGNSYHNAGEYAPAVDLYRKAIELDDSVPFFWSNLSGSLDGLGLTQESLEAREKAGQLEGGLFSAPAS